MFQSYNYIKFLNYDAIIDQYQYQYEIIDTNFVALIGIHTIAISSVVVEIITKIIQIYKERKLNVSANLIMAMQYIENQYGSRDYSIPQQIEKLKIYVSEYSRYEKDVAKYLALL